MMNQNILINNISNNNTAVELTMAVQDGQTVGKAKLLSPEEAETAEEREERLKAAACLSKDSTYEELRAASLSTYSKYVVDGKPTGETKPIRASKAEHLMKSDVKVLIEGVSGEMQITVYENGFFIAMDTSDPDQHMTVDGVERAFINIGADKGNSEDIKEVMKMPWIEVLAMDAQFRLDHNEENRETDKTELAIRGDGSDTVSGMVVQDHVTELENAEREAKAQDMRRTMREKLPKALDALKTHSEKQWVVVVGRFSEKPTLYKDLAAELGVSEKRINVLMNKGLSFLRKYMEEDKELQAHMSALEN
ncbi:MAG: sigma-70 family RNA polymerase sigma factor [Oribacterium sp.]|nr:sigma-70 family RNA polymerase sigma factor [Lachnospiraceae bacterium]MBR1857642.1 sigma-70 family RNA polymerase sigma factor [Oribacterium sp.]